MSVAERPVRSNKAGLLTRQLLLKTAERLFAERGIDAVSLREIGKAAGMQMSHGVSYHFGDKDGLIRAIVEAGAEGRERRRAQRLAEVERVERSLDLRAATELAVSFAVAEIHPGSYRYRFLAQLDRHPQAMADAFAGEADQTMLRITRLQEHLCSQHLPPAVVEHRVRLVRSLSIAAFADLETRRPTGKTRKFIVSDLVDCLIALFSTPPSATTQTALPAQARRKSAPRTSSSATQVGLSR
jgi:AcrR family transcriptional regulator